MMSDDFFRMKNYYPFIAHASLPASFAMLREAEIMALASGDKKGPAVESAIRRLGNAMSPFPKKCFVTTDFAAPTDSEKYLSARSGMAVSGTEAWNILVESAKIRNLAAAGKVSCVTVRAFRVFDVPREFRLFIRGGELKAMSQRFLIRHFHRLERRKAEYWDIACAFWKENKGLIPAEDFTMDIYITTAKKILVLDLNPWGEPTDHLMLRSWDEDLSEPLGCLIVPPPYTLSGDVNVSF